MAAPLSTVQQNIFISKLEPVISQLFANSDNIEDKNAKYIWISFREGTLILTCLHYGYTLQEFQYAPCSDIMIARVRHYIDKFYKEVAEMDFNPHTGRAPIERVQGHLEDDEDYDADGEPIENPLNSEHDIPTVNCRLPDSMYNMKRGIRTLEKTILARQKRYRVARKRSRAYSRDLRNGYVGTLAYRAASDPLREAGNRLHALTASDLLTKKRQVALYAIYGRGGSRKSADLKDWARKYLKHDSHLRNRAAITIICPTNHLRAEWIKSMDTQWTYMIKTLETALFETPNRVVIADDISKFPAGYFDAFLILHSHVNVLIVTADVLQLSYKSPNVNAETNSLEGEADRFAKFADYYFNFTYRAPRALARRFGITTYSAVEGSYIPNPRPYIDHGVIIVPGMQQELDLIGNGREAYTYSNSQGLDFDDVHVVIDRNTHAMDFRALNTAFTRARVNLSMHNYTRDLELPLFAALFGAARNDQMVDFMTREILRKMPGVVILNEDPRINKKKMEELYNFSYDEDTEYTPTLRWDEN